MKRCPECRRDYYDETLLYCLDDGAALLEGPVADQAATAILPNAAFEAATRTFDPEARDRTTRPIGRQGNRSIFAAALISLLVAIAAGFGIFKYFSAPKPVPFRSMRLTKLTANGKATHAVIAPDGKQLVYVIDDGGLRSLWLRHIATGADVQLVPPDERFYWSLTVSSDGNFLYFVSAGMGLQNRVLHRMPFLGGSPQKVVEDIGSPVSFSPDGKQIAFVRSQEGESRLMVSNADGGNERVIGVRNEGEGGYGNFFQGGTSWSPDGRVIAVIARDVVNERVSQNVVVVPADGGPERPVTSNWYQIQRIAWLSDGSGILMTAAQEPADFRSQQIWYVPYPNGEPQKVTNDLNDYRTISLNADSSTLVSVQSEAAANIWVAPDGDFSKATEITSVSSKLDGSIGLAWTPDGKIVYHSMAAGKEAIWIMDADGKNRKQLTSDDGVDFFPSVSLDGSSIYFVSERTDRRNVWRMNMDGTNQNRLARGTYPSGTGEWVFYQADRRLWKQPVNGGEPVPLSENLSWCGLSPDGKLLGCSLYISGSANKLAVVSTLDAEIVKVFDVQPTLPAKIRWTPAGREITYVAHQNGTADIWSQPLAGGSPKKLTNLKADEIFSFDWSRDNKLAISHGSANSDVVLITNTR